MKYIKAFESWEDDTPSVEKIALYIYKKLEKDCKPFLDELRKCYQQRSEPDDLFSRYSLNDYVNNNVPFIYRGSSKTSGVIRKVKSRKDRRPKDLNKRVSKEIDERLYKEYGVKPRSQGVFTTPIKDDASSYGASCLFFPIGEYKYIWSDKIRDLFDELRLVVNELYSWYLLDVDENYRKTSLDNEIKSYYNDNYPFVNFSQTDFINLESGKNSGGFSAEEFKSVKSKKEKELEAYKSKMKKKWLDSLGDFYIFNENLCGAINLKNYEITFFCDEYYIINLENSYSDELRIELVRLIFE